MLTVDWIRFLFSFEGRVSRRAYVLRFLLPWFLMMMTATLLVPPPPLSNVFQRWFPWSWRRYGRSLRLEQSAATTAIDRDGFS